MTIPLHGRKAAGRVVLINERDHELVSAYSWSAWEKIREGLRNCGPYAQATIRPGGRKTTIRMHVLLTGWPLVDHANGNGLDNRRENLRPATSAQNSQNRHSFTGSSSRFKGVCWYKAGRQWAAYINADGKRTHLGYFDDEIAAALAYDAAARQLHGRYGRLNFPDAA